LYPFERMWLQCGRTSEEIGPILNACCIFWKPERCVRLRSRRFHWRMQSRLTGSLKCGMYQASLFLHILTKARWASDRLCPEMTYYPERMAMSKEQNTPEGAEAVLGPYALGPLKLKNRIVMSPMTRGRTESEERAPSSLEAEYYEQRTSAGLIITGGTYISKQAIGSIRVPGIYSHSHVEAWKRVTSAVDSKGGKIFLQIAHSGSVSHPDLLGGELPVSPSPINPLQKVFTPAG
jgi:hypothetical protein